MEEFFKQPILEKLYDFLSMDFEERLLHDKKESKKAAKKENGNQT